MGVACTSLVPGDARFKPGGSVAWSRTWAGPSAGNDSCRSLCLVGTRGLFAGGTVGGSGGLDAMAAKYIRWAADDGRRGSGSAASPAPPVTRWVRPAGSDDLVALVGDLDLGAIRHDLRVID